MSKPHFIIMGERRSGSTTLYHMLSQHPEVSMLQPADFDYFIEPELFGFSPPTAALADWDSTHSTEEYASLFERLEGVVGQKDADLLWWYPAHARLARYLPEVRFLVVLRDPVKRAISQYYNERAKGRETRSISEALAPADNKGAFDWQRLHLTYLERGCFHKSLEEFYKHVPSSRVLVVFLEELRDERTRKAIGDFLTLGSAIDWQPPHTNKERLLVRRKSFEGGLPGRLIDLWERATEALIVRMFRGEARNHWRGRLRSWYTVSARDSEPVSEDLIARLKAYYQEPNRKLMQLLGRDSLPW
jgi:hypothetical protein